MFAKQTIRSASLVVVFLGCSVIAHADPDAPDEPAAGEVRPTTGTFQIGVGFSSYDGFVGMARVAQPSLFGTGHSLSLDASVSQRRHHFSLDYMTPELGDGIQLSASLFSESRQLPGFVREGNGAGVSLSKRLSPHLRAFGGYRIEHVSSETTPFDGSIIVARGSSPEDHRSGLISSLHAGLEYNSLDRPDVPTRGTAIGAMYEIADRRLGSDFTFDRVRAWASHHRQIGPLTLHVGGRLESIQGIDVPRTERLFLDGATDIRGFAPGALGSIDAFGNPVGGTTKFTMRAELEAPLVRRIGLSAVGFFDAGGIVDSTHASLGRSVGLGLLWRSPIGPLRFDWAFPLDGAGPPRFLFSIGGGW